MTTRMAVLMWLLLAAARTAGAQDQTQVRPALARQPETSAALAPVADERDARDTKERLRTIFDQYPPSLVQVLRLEPSLLSRSD